MTQRFFRPPSRGGGGNVLPSHLFGLSGLGQGLGAVADAIQERSDRKDAEAIRSFELGTQAGLSREDAARSLSERGLIPADAEIPQSTEELVNLIEANALQASQDGTADELQGQIARRILTGDPLLDTRLEGMETENILARLRVQDTERVLQQQTALDEAAGVALSEAGLPSELGFAGYDLLTAQHTAQRQAFEESLQTIEQQLLQAQAQGAQQGVDHAEVMNPLLEERGRIQNELLEIDRKFAPMLANAELMTAKSNVALRRAQAHAAATEARLNPVAIQQARDIMPMAATLGLTPDDVIAGVSGQLQDPVKQQQFQAAQNAFGMQAFANIQKTLIDAQNAGFDTRVGRLSELAGLMDGPLAETLDARGIMQAELLDLFQKTYGLDESIIRESGGLFGMGNPQFSISDELIAQGIPAEIANNENLDSFSKLMMGALSTESVQSGNNMIEFDPDVIKTGIQNGVTEYAQRNNLSVNDPAAAQGMLNELNEIDMTELDRVDRAYLTQLRQELERNLPEVQQEMQTSENTRERETIDILGVPVPKDAGPDELNTILAGIQQDLSVAQEQRRTSRGFDRQVANLRVRELSAVQHRLRARIKALGRASTNIGIEGEVPDQGPIESGFRPNRVSGVVPDSPIEALR